MALIKRVYVDGETIITAQNLNDIQDTVIAHESNKVPTTRTVNSKALSSNITLSASDVGAVPTTRTVNSKALSSNITLSASDVGAVPTTRTVNSKALSSNITIDAGDIGYSSSTTYSASTVGNAIKSLSTRTTGTITKANANLSGTLDRTTCVKVGNTVTVSGRIHTMDNETANQAFFMIPSGYRPSVATSVMGYIVIVNEGFYPLMVQVGTDGNVSFAFSNSKQTTQVGFSATYVI